MRERRDLKPSGLQSALLFNSIAYLINLPASASQPLAKPPN
jgi:hypothetical protein